MRISLSSSVAILSFCAPIALSVDRTFAEVIVTDGRTATQLVTNGFVTDVTTGTVSGGYGVNSFRQFGVTSWDTVNLHTPSGAAGTVNVVTGGRSVINGTLRGVRNGTVGGDHHLVNPHGVTVGVNGKVIAGSVGISTPTQGFAEGLVSTDGQVDDRRLGAVVAGTDPQGAGTLDIHGEVSATHAVRLRAGGGIDISGRIASGDRAAVLGAAVNLGRTGSVTVAAGDTVAIASGGRVVAGAQDTGGQIDIRAGGDITLDRDAFVDVRGLGDGDAGVAILFADGSAELRPGAVVSAAALGAGDGGFAEFSATDRVQLGGALQAWSAMGQGGEILVDPAVIELAPGDPILLSAGARQRYIASDRIVLQSGAVLSTRNIGTATDHFRAVSTGDSGNVVLRAPEIVIEAGASVLTFANGGFRGGDILLDARVDDSNPADASRAPSPSGRAEITVSNALLWGRDITLQSLVLKDEAFSSPGAVSDYVNDRIGATGIGLIDTFITNQAANLDTNVAGALASVDAAQLPALLSARAKTTVRDSYIQQAAMLP